MQVPAQEGAVDVRLATLHHLQQGVMQEHVLLLRLHQEVTLRPDVLQEAEDVQLALGTDHPHHGVEHDVGARPTHAGAAQTGQRMVNCTGVSVCN